jgi:site-specific recombinase XerD
MELRTWQARYRDYLSIVKGWSPSTVDVYSRELKPFFAFLDDHDVTSVSGITRKSLEDYRGYLYRLKPRGKNLTLSTQGVRLAAIKQFARFLYREQYLLVDVAAGVELPRRAQRLPRVILSEREALAAPGSPRLEKSGGPARPGHLRGLLCDGDAQQRAARSAPRRLRLGPPRRVYPAGQRRQAPCRAAG